jgi:hypothetical protein
MAVHILRPGWNGLKRMQTSDLPVIFDDLKAKSGFLLSYAPGGPTIGGVMKSLCMKAVDTHGA